MHSIKHKELPKIDDISSILLVALGKTYVKNFMLKNHVKLKSYKYIGYYKSTNSLNMFYTDGEFTSRFRIKEDFLSHTWTIGKGKHSLGKINFHSPQP